MALNALDEPQYLLLQVLLPLSALLQLARDFLQPRTDFQFHEFFPQLEEGLTLVPDDVLMAVCEGASEADALPAGEADMRGLIEVQRALAGGMPDGLLLGLAGRGQTGCGKPLRLGGRLLRRTVRLSGLVPHHIITSVGWLWFTLYYNSKMEQDLQRYDLVQGFLASLRLAQSKQEFMHRVQEFDLRFTDEQNNPAFSEKQKSTEKLPPMPMEKPRNPFKTNLEENFRHGASNLPQGHSPFTQPQQPVRAYSRTQQNFYKNPTAAKDPYSQLNSSFGYGAPNQPNYGQQGNYNPQPNQGNQGGMGVLNYNAYSQKEYDELKQEFFRAPPPRPDPYAKLQENYGNPRQEGFAQMGLGMSSSVDLLENAGRPSARGYSQRGNPFMRQ